MFAESSLRLLALGNFSTLNILQLTAQLKVKVKIQPKPFYTVKRLHADPEQGPLNYVLDSELDDDALISIYLSASEDPMALAKAELLDKLLTPAFYDQIRTQEQLTYSPFTATFQVNDSVAYGLFTQSPAIGSAALYERFQVFIDGFSGVLNETKESDFEEIKKAHIANYLAKPTNIKAEFGYLIGEWTSNKQNIDTKLEYVDKLKSVTLGQVQQYYKDIFFNKAQVQQILVQVKGKKFYQDKPLILESEVSITDIDKLSK
jgi:protease III